MNHHAQRHVPLLALALLIVAAPMRLQAAEQTKLRVLLLAGRNNHDETKTTPALVELLEASGRFDVTTTVPPKGLTAESLRRYNVVLSNWTNWPDITKREWGPEAEKPLVDFVRGGKGLAVFHAANTPFQTWPEFQRIIGATWKLKQTGHGRIHTFGVKIADKTHPITAGVPDFDIRDELWHRIGMQPDAHVLATAHSSPARGGSGKDEVVALCTTFGKGRGFNLILGHDTTAMANPGWQTLMLRGLEWAATGQVTIPPRPKLVSKTTADIGKLGDLDADLEAAATYAFGKSRMPLARLRAWTQRATTDEALRDKLAAKMTAMLTPGPLADVTPACKRFLCEQLGLIGTAKEVPVLTGLLYSDELTLAARGALERIPAPEAAAAIRGEIPKADGKIRIGLIHSVGQRRDADAVDILIKQLNSQESAVALAAVDALGRLGNEEALQALLAAHARHAEPARKRIDAALIDSADALVAAGKTSHAIKVYDRLSAKTCSEPIRQAAFLGKLKCDKANADALIVASLAGDDAVLRKAAFRALHTDEAKTATQRSSAMMTQALKLAKSTPAKRALLEALTAVHTTRALHAAIACLADQAVRAQAAITTLRIAEGLARSAPREARIAVHKVMADQKNPGIRAHALGVLLQVAKPKNLAADAKATSPDDLDKDGASHGDQAAIDGDPDTYWDEVNDRKLYRLRITMPEPRHVSALYIIGYRHHDYAPKDFDILCDGKVVREVRGAKYARNQLIVPIPRTRCTTVELAITGYYGKSPAISELGLYDTDALAEAMPEPISTKRDLRWDKTDASLALMNGDKPVWRLRFGKDVPKSCFDPIALVDGAVLTWLSPPDHPWHRAFWFSWKFINGLNYWEEDRKTGKSEGVTELTAVTAKPRDDFSADIELRISYHPPDKPPVLTEVRKLHVSAPDAEGRYTVDWHSTFTAGDADVVFDRTPLPGEPEGKSWGGYAGLSVRFAKGFTDWRAVDSEGRTGLDTHAKPARWLDVSGRLPDGRLAGMTLMDHPKNPRFPAPSFLILNPKVPFAYASPALLYHKALKLPAGKTLTLRYHVVVHPHQGKPEQIEAAWTHWSKP